MNRYLLVILLVLVGALPVVADECTGGINIFHLNFGGNCKSNTIGADQLTQFYEKIREAADQINALPDQIRKAGPNGTSISSIGAGVSQIMGYVKWLFSPATAQELLGPDLAPIGQSVLVLFTMGTALTAIWIAINLVVFTVKMIVWAINQILKLIPFW